MLADIEQLRAAEIGADLETNILLLTDEPRANAFYAREGELGLRIAGSERTLEPGTWAFVPADVPYSLFTGGRPARLLHVQVGGGASREVVVRRAGGSEGDTITDRPGRRATVLVEADELTISEFAYGPGERGAKPHVHREHADAFLVLEGGLTLHLRDGSRILPAGTLVVVPPGVVHGFDNDSDVLMRCFNFHTPSLGFAAYMRGRNPGFDQHDPPENGGVDPTALVLARLSG